jgi:SAM-dependent methyltransferase
MDIAALIEIGNRLKSEGYRFITVTPLTHARVLARPRPLEASLRDVFGWNHAFEEKDIPQSYWALLREGDLLVAAPGGWRSRVRFSSLGGLLFAHSSYPTIHDSSVFFGPDTYRFARAIQTTLESDPTFSPKHLVDIGCGSGAGGMYCASLLAPFPRVTLVDINAHALDFARVNAVINEQDVDAVASDLFHGVQGEVDFVISNPPYLVDAAHRMYRDGGGRWGCDLAVRIVTESLHRLSANGRLLLYTGAPIVSGEDMFLHQVRSLLNKMTTGFQYEEIDPDVFGDELENAPYDQAERIAAVALIVDARNIRR